MLCVGVWFPVHVGLGWQPVVSLQGNQMAQGFEHAAVNASTVNPGHAAADLNHVVDAVTQQTGFSGVPWKLRFVCYCFFNYNFCFCAYMLLGTC